MSIDVSTIVNVLRQADPALTRDGSKFAWGEDDMINAFVEVAKLSEPRFCLDKENTACVINLMRWLLSDEKMKAVSPTSKQAIKGRISKGIYLYGPTGTGKTLALNTLGRIAYALGYKYYLSGLQGGLKWESVRTDELIDRYSHGGTLTDFVSIPILCFEDLGSETTEAVYMGNRVNVMRSIIERRGESRNKITLFTSNIPLDSPDLVAKYGDRAVSRLTDMCNFLILRGPDHRIV